MRWYNMCPLVTGFSHLTCFWSSSIFLAYISTSFLFMIKYYPLYRYSAICLSIYLLDIWVVFTFWLLWIVLLWTYVYKHVFWVPVFNSFGYIPRDGIARSYGNSIFKFLRNLVFTLKTMSLGHKEPQRWLMAERKVYLKLTSQIPPN